MSTYTQILYQIVNSTKNREQTLLKPIREELYKHNRNDEENSKSFQ